MKKYTREHEEDEVGASIDSLEELDWDDRIDRVLDIDVPAGDTPVLAPLPTPLTFSDLPGPSSPPPAPRQTRAKRRVRPSSKTATAPIPLPPPSKRRRPALLVDRGHDGGSEENVCPSQIPARQTRAKRRVRPSSKTATASTPWPLPSKRSRPAPLVDRGHDGGSEENVCPSQIPARQTRTKRRVRPSSKTATAPIPLPPPSKASTRPAPPVDRWHDGAEEDVCPPQFPFCPEDARTAA
ncbi:wiskott-Aldrich syndrome protein homolog 1-like [Clupea harengus]|uniref:Wiskott-Aldrich syndrome protein homolog 1-like n=1 Tax=Clupea harengus TaxID=7950 RepID=A0A6P8H549_CLUHA|nr:wiskott-Aldrich syndrome protein homolog 1-like [Clupea harengus]